MSLRYLPPLPAPTCVREVFTASGTWTRPKGAVSVHVVCIGGGGAGGNNRANDPLAAAGRGGGFSQATLDAEALGASVNIVVGRGGAGGVAGNEVNGEADFRPTGGSASSFGSWCQVFGGNTSSAGYPVGSGAESGYAGGGGARSSAAYGGGAGGPGANPGGASGGLEGGAIGASGLSRSGSGLAGSGGGGGGGGSNAGRAGNGGIPGGGGGSTTSFSKPSGDGGRGEVIVTTYF